MFAGLQPNRTTSASSTPRRFLFWKISTGIGDVSVVFMRLAVAGRRTQAMNRVGMREGGSVEGVVVPDGEGDGDELPGEEIALRIPERTLVPIVP